MLLSLHRVTQCQMSTSVSWVGVLRIDFCLFFFFQAEDGIRYLVRSRGLGDVYKRQAHIGDVTVTQVGLGRTAGTLDQHEIGLTGQSPIAVQHLSLIHI